MIDTEARRRGDTEMEKLKQMLTESGVEWKERGGSAPVVSFKNGHYNCFAFSSQTYDGKMCVHYETKAYVDTAEEALRICGVIE